MSETIPDVQRLAQLLKDRPLESTLEFLTTISQLARDRVLADPNASANAIRPSIDRSVLALSDLAKHLQEVARAQADADTAERRKLQAELNHLRARFAKQSEELAEAKVKEQGLVQQEEGRRKKRIRSIEDDLSRLRAELAEEKDKDKDKEQGRETNGSISEQGGTG